MTNILMGTIKRPEFTEKLLHGKLGDCFETGEGASNQLQGSREFDAPHPLH
jgi:hypothetical protein